MFYAVVAVSVVLIFAATTSIFPARRGVLATLAYPVGWIAGELCYYALIVEAGLVTYYALRDHPVSWRLEVVVALAGVAALLNLVLVATLWRAHGVVERALSRHERPLAVSRHADRFSTWWRSATLLSLHPRDLHLSANLAYGPHRRHRLDLWRTTTTPQRAPVIFYLHGGAWTFGDKREQGRPMLHEFVARGWIVATANYRLAPRDPWPAQIEDVTRALAWLKKNVAAYGGDPERVVVAGGSAGGHLAALLALSSDDPTWRPSDVVGVTDWRVAGVIPLYGVLEMTGDERHWRGLGAGIRALLEGRIVQRPYDGHEDLYRSLSPMQRIHEAAPPFLVVQGAVDTLVDVNVARGFVERFAEIALAPIYYVELPLTQHAFDVTASARTSATTRAAIAFAESVVASTPPRAATLHLYERAGASLVVDFDGEWLSAAQAVARLGTFFVVTAENPGSRLLSEEQNASRRALLEATLARRAVARRATRVAGLEGWGHESGVAIPGRPASFAHALAAAFDQAALYRVDETGVSVEVVGRGCCRGGNVKDGAT
jgi:acetyl esterase/lipase